MWIIGLQSNDGVERGSFRPGAQGRPWRRHRRGTSSPAALGLPPTLTGQHGALSQEVCVGSTEQVGGLPITNGETGAQRGQLS